MVLPCALHRAVRKYLQVKSSSAVQLSPPENTFEVRQIRRCARRESVPGDQRLPEERAGAVPKRCQHEVGADLRDTFDPENASNFPHSSGRGQCHRVNAERLKFREEVLRKRFCVLRYLPVTYFMFTSGESRNTDTCRQNTPLPIAPILIIWFYLFIYFFWMMARFWCVASRLLSVIMQLLGRSLVPPWSRGWDAGSPTAERKRCKGLRLECQGWWGRCKTRRSINGRDFYSPGVPGQDHPPPSLQRRKTRSWERGDGGAGTLHPCKILRKVNMHLLKPQQMIQTNKSVFHCYESVGHLLHRPRWFSSTGAAVGCLS